MPKLEKAVIATLAGLSAAIVTLDVVDFKERLSKLAHSPNTYELQGGNCPDRPTFQGQKLTLPNGCVIR